VSDSNCASCGARFKNGDYDNCPACRTRRHPVVRDPSKDLARVESVWLRYGKNLVKTREIRPYVEHREFCFFSKARICTCGLLSDLLEITGSEAHDIYLDFFQDLHDQLAAFERIEGAP